MNDTNLHLAPAGFAQQAPPRSDRVTDGAMEQLMAMQKKKTPASSSWMQALLSLLLLLAATSQESCRRRLVAVGERCNAGEANCVCATATDCRIVASDDNTNSGTNGRCVPTTCAAQGATCGEIPDTCGRTLRCGSCDAPLVCDLQTHTCGDCQPTTCAAKNKKCGIISDGCGGLLNCDAEPGGGCLGTQTCGGSGVPNDCGCTPKTCAELGATCGSKSDGCGGTVDCDVQIGGCPPGQNCDPTTNSCFVPNCTPKTCSELGNPCGPVSDGCGRTITCGAAGRCSDGQLCDPESHQCVAYNPNNGELGRNEPPGSSPACGDRQCGSFLDACNVDHTCGGSAEQGTCGGPGEPACQCASNQVCRGNLCKSCTGLTSCPPGTCGEVSDGCGGVLQCGTTSAVGANGGGRCDQRGQVCDPILARCVDPRPTNCQAEGKNCGYIFDGQGNLIFCGNCTAPEECGGAGQGNVCGIKPAVKACLDNNAECGTVRDSCGNPYQCGTCATNRRCQADNTCIDCVAQDYRTCEQIQVTAQPRKCGTALDRNCGLNDLGCGCEMVGPRYTCSSNTPGVIGDCVCTPNVTCASANACNTTIADDGCGNPINCGACPGGGSQQCNETSKQCCAVNAPYNPDNGQCCGVNDVLHGTAPSRLCCGAGITYNPDSNQCCASGEVLNDEGNTGTPRVCCIANRYNPTNNTCCAGEYNDVTASCCPAGQVETNGVCCASGLAGNPDPTPDVCCPSGESPQGTLGSRICCTAGRFNPDPTPDVCCPSGESPQGTAGTRICCTAARYVDHNNTCCPGGQHASGTPEICCADGTDSNITTGDGNRVCCPAGQQAVDIPGAPTTDAMCCATGSSAVRPWNNAAGAAICCPAGQVNNGGVCCANPGCGQQCGGSYSACGGAFTGTCDNTVCVGDVDCGPSSTVNCCNTAATPNPQCCTPATCGTRCSASGNVTNNCGGTVSGCNCGGNPAECNTSTGTCCPTGRVFNASTNACCGAGLTLFGAPSVCCTAARFNPNNNTCCAGQYNTTTGQCCASGQNVSNGVCCAGSQVGNPDPNPDICCPGGQTLFGTAPNRVCCTAGNFNTVSGSCCAGPFNSTTGQCCAAGQNVSSGICCPAGQSNSGGICCPAGQTNTGGICCAAGQINAGGICCSSGQVNSGGSCCTPPSASECTSAGQSAGVCNGSITRCGQTVNCANVCPANFTCLNNACCGDITCANQGKICGGPYTNACGDATEASCGTCPNGRSCTQNGTCCRKTSCVDTGHTCGQDSDLCGGFVSCGGCTPPFVCGAGTDPDPQAQRCCLPIDPGNQQVCPCGTQKFDTCLNVTVNCAGCGGTGG